MSELSRTKGRPLYRQFASLLRERIREGTWPRGATLPSLAELSGEFGVRKPVVRRGLELLALEGWVRPGASAGQWVASRPRPVHGVLLAWDPARLIPESSENPTIRVVSKALTTLPRNLLQVFDVHGREGHRANRITKLYLDGREPVAFETIFAPVSVLPGLLMKDHRVENLYKMIRFHYNLNIRRVEQRFLLTRLTREEASYLGAEENQAGLCVTQTVYGETAAFAFCRLVRLPASGGWLQEGHAERVCLSHIPAE